MTNKDIIINKQSREIINGENGNLFRLGVDGENLQENLVFKFDDEFVNGTARVEVITQNNVKSYIMTTKQDETYILPVKSVITKKGLNTMQLVITQGTSQEEIPIFKSKEFSFYIDESINAESEPPEEYEEWIDEANTKLNQLDNINIQAEKVGTTATITITDKSGQETSVNIYDGEKGETGEQGPQGIQGIQGQPGTNGVGISSIEKTSTSGLVDTYTITYTNNNTSTFNVTNGQNGTNGTNGRDGTNGTNGRDGYVQYTAGNNITIENNVISATGGSSYGPDNKLNADYIDDTNKTNQFNYNGTISQLRDSNLQQSAVNFKLAKKGIYVCDINNYSLTYNNSINDTGTSSGSIYPAFIIMLKDISNITSVESNFDFAIVYGFNNYGRVETDKYYINTSKQIKKTQLYVGNHYVINTGEQDISGEKTFSSIPKVSSYSAPTENTQLVAKKYVDDKIGDINTILATLTTPSGGE